MKTTAVRLHSANKSSIADTITAMDKPNVVNKLCCNHTVIPPIAVDGSCELGKPDPMCAELEIIVEAQKGLRCFETEEHLPSNAKAI